MNFQIKKTDIFYIFLYLNVFCKGIGLNNSSKIYLLLICLGLLAVFLKMFSDKFTKKEIGIIAFMLLIGVGTFIFTKSPTFLLTSITLSGMKNINIDKTFKGMFKIRFITYIVMVGFSLLGVIPNKSVYMYRDNGFDIRYALGYGHPNTTQINLFIIIALYIYIRYEKLNVFDYLVLVASNIFIYSYTLSRTGFVCIFILIILAIYSKVGKKEKILLLKMPKIIFMFMLIFSILTAILYGKLDIINELNSIFNGRIAYSHYYWNQYGLSLLGNNLREDDNAIFDNGYLYIIIQFGVLCFGIIAWLLLKIFRNIRLENDTKKAIIVIPFLIYIFTESFAPNIFMNIILLFAAPLIFNDEENKVNDNEGDELRKKNEYYNFNANL